MKLLLGVRLGPTLQNDVSPLSVLFGEVSARTPHPPWHHHHHHQQKQQQHYCQMKNNRIQNWPARHRTEGRRQNLISRCTTFYVVHVSLFSAVQIGHINQPFFLFPFYAVIQYVHSITEKRVVCFCYMCHFDEPQCRNTLVCSSCSYYGTIL